MPYRTLTAEQLTPRIGALIGGIDLTAPLEPEALAEVNRAIIEHQVIFFRDQRLDPAALRCLGLQFGALQPHALQGLREFPEVRRLHADAASTHVAGEEWHTDMSCATKPPMGSILYLHTLPCLGGDTVFASMYAAYDALSDRMKTYLDGLTATHDGRLAFGRFDPDGKYPIAVHPVIREHPVSGRKVLYVNKGFTSHINEVSPAESDAILRLLFDHVQNAYFHCRFRWEPHSVAFWDNRCTQHLAIWDYYPQVRSGFRVQIEDAAVAA